MNTGKTYHLRKELLKYENWYQIVVGFRRTYSLDYAEKM